MIGRGRGNAGRINRDRDGRHRPGNQALLFAPDLVPEARWNQLTSSWSVSRNGRKVAPNSRSALADDRSTAGLSRYCHKTF
jgi:hypothetical protein